MTTEAEALRARVEKLEVALEAIADTAAIMRFSAGIVSIRAICRDALAAKPAPPPAVEQGDAFICPMGHSETHYGADMEDERPCCDKCGRRMVPAPSPAPAEPLAKVDAALNRVMEGETMTATASDDGSGHVTVKVATENPAHATSRGAGPCEKCGKHLRRITFWVDGIRKEGRESCLDCCSPPAAAKDEPAALRQCGVCCKLYAETVELRGQPVRCIHCLGVALEKAQADDDAIRAQARREATQRAYRAVIDASTHAPTEPILSWMLKCAEAVQDLLDTPTAPTLDEVKHEDWCESVPKECSCGAGRTAWIEGGR